ncbi:MAG: C39 family peptidase [Anaerolineales bacterium]|nr:C39 family peptidase [Anaerolineales bacterium]
MSKRSKRIIAVVATAQLLVALGIFLLPQIVRAMPSHYQLAIQERLPISVGLFEAVQTPVPDLPAAAGAVSEITVPTLVFEPVATATATLAPTTAPTEPAAAETAAPTDEPTPLPTDTPAPTPTNTPRPLPVRARLEGLQNIPQEFNNCGPANMTVVLNFHGNAITQGEVASYLKPNPEDRNVSPWQLRDYVNEFTGLGSSAHSGGNLTLLKQIIAAGYPVIVEKGYDPNTAEGWYGHYLTLFGFDDETRQFAAMDTYQRPFSYEGTTEDYDVLEDYWRHFNYTFVVIYPLEDETLIRDILGPEMLDEQTMWQNAALKAQADIDKNPEDAYAWFNLGTNLTRLGELTGENQYYQDGAAAFDNARAIGLPYRMLWYQFRPYTAYMKVGRYQDMLDLANATLETSGGQNVEETYLFRGHANAYLGNFAQARADYQKALDLNSNFYPAQIALDSLSG